MRRCQISFLAISCLHLALAQEEGFVLLSSLLGSSESEPEPEPTTTSSLRAATTTKAPSPGPGLALLPASSENDLGGLEAWVLSMARSKVTVDNTTLGFVKQIQQMVEDMLPQVLNRCHEGIAELERLIEAFDQCKLGSLEPKKDWGELQIRHIWCRGNESHQALAAEAARHVWLPSDAVRQKECKEFSVIDNIPSHDECGLPQHSDQMRFYAQALRDKFKHKYEEWIQRKEDCDAATATARELRERMDALEEQRQQLRSMCNSLQDQLDHKACSASEAVQHRCHGYEECYARARISFLEQNRTVAALEQEMKQEYRALKRILCLLETFEGGGLEESELEDCRQQTVNLDVAGIDWSPHKIPPPVTNCSRVGPAWPNATSPEYAADVYGAVARDVRLKECSAVPCCQALYS